MDEKKKIITKKYDSPCGTLVLGSFEDKLCLCDWMVEKHHDQIVRRVRRVLNAEFEEGCSEVLEEAARQLDEYFERKRQEFDIPLMLVGTDFQKEVWATLLSIPYGQRVSYGYISRLIDKPKAVRAVANANGANAISILVPCHRVIGSDDSLTGYGGGILAKEYLLSLEKK